MKGGVNVAPGDRAMKPAWTMIVCVLLLGFSLPAGAQFFAVCDTGSKAELDENIRAHEEHIGRLENKLVTGWYWQGKRSKEFHPVTLADVRSRLAETAPRRTAVLFHAYDESRRRLCAWLIVGPATVRLRRQARGQGGPPRARCGRAVHG